MTLRYEFTFKNWHYTMNLLRKKKKKHYTMNLLKQNIKIKEKQRISKLTSVLKDFPHLHPVIKSLSSFQLRVTLR